VIARTTLSLLVVILRMILIVMPSRYVLHTLHSFQFLTTVYAKIYADNNFREVPFMKDFENNNFLCK
jgi:hypothetical protein